MKIIRTRNELRVARDSLGGGVDIGLVPTMGALHSGHLALLEAARAECAFVVASIFVNPTQFGPGEDFEAYPRDEERDAQTAAAAGVDCLFVPPVEQIYPDGFQTWVEVASFSKGLEGDARPDHFRGVATVCLKLFNLVRPRRAYFGQKDAQQTAVVQRLVRDLDLDVQIRVIETVRDHDGLAVSSRNAYLSPDERAAARALPRSLLAGAEAYRHGADAVAAARVALSTETRLTPEYVELARFDGRVHLVAAARVGRTRLIDNILLEGELT